MVRVIERWREVAGWWEPESDRKVDRTVFRVELSLSGRSPSAGTVIVDLAWRSEYRGERRIPGERGGKLTGPLTSLLTSLSTGGPGGSSDSWIEGNILWRDRGYGRRVPSPGFCTLHGVHPPLLPAPPLRAPARAQRLFLRARYGNPRGACRSRRQNGL